MYALVLTLGHNSSAVLVEISTGTILVGYEEERLSRVKSDSKFPILAISECLKYYKASYVTEIFISHWGIFPEEFIVESKYFKPHLLKQLVPNATLWHYTDKHFSHHDAHIVSAEVFAGKDYLHNTLGIVVDGFGNYGETWSIYSYFNGSRTLLHRCFGFESSIGLFYQYATSFLGMKENQDEYKLLGYAPRYFDLVNDDLVDDDTVTNEICSIADKIIDAVFNHDMSSALDPMISISALPATKLYVRERLQLAIDRCEKSKLDSTNTKVLIAHITQSVTEFVVTDIVMRFIGMNQKQLLLSGGVFMNVALNNKLSEIASKVCIMPLCGDQGAGLGAYHNEYKNLKWPGHLYWGKRNLAENYNGEGITYISGEDHRRAVEYIADALNRNEIVNLVQGSMEFGARALGNTSSLMLPTEENINAINKANDRATIMPCAPVVRDCDINAFFDARNIDKVHKSLEYMICTRNIIGDQYIDEIRGAVHRSLEGPYTSRVQVLRRYTNPILYDVLELIPGRMLVNTSFNYHGEPINFINHAETTKKQVENLRSEDKKLSTVVIY